MRAGVRRGRERRAPAAKLCRSHTPLDRQGGTRVGRLRLHRRTDRPDGGPVVRDAAQAAPCSRRSRAWPHFARILAALTAAIQHALVCWLFLTDPFLARFGEIQFTRVAGPSPRLVLPNCS